MTEPRPDADQPLVMDVPTAAKRLGMAAKTFRRHVQHGSIKAVWLGGLLRVHMSEVRRAAVEGLPRLPRMPDYERNMQARAERRAAARVEREAAAAKAGKARPPGKRGPGRPPKPVAGERRPTP